MVNRREFLSTSVAVVGIGLSGCLKSSGYRMEVSKVENNAAGRVVAKYVEYKGDIGVGVYTQQPQSLAVVPPWISLEEFSSWDFPKQRPYIFESVKGEGLWFIGENGDKEGWEKEVQKKHDSLFSDYSGHSIIERGEMEEGDEFKLVQRNVDQSPLPVVSTITLTRG